MRSGALQHRGLIRVSESPSLFFYSVRTACVQPKSTEASASRSLIHRGLKESRKAVEVAAALDITDNRYQRLGIDQFIKRHII